MFRRPLQIWIAYLLALTVVVTAMVWLSQRAMQLDQARNELLGQTEIASRDASRRDLVTSTLWRMDSMLTPLVGPEATRPYALYQPFLVTRQAEPKSEDPQLTPSPLLRSPSQFVILHFQIRADGQWSSPQTPQGVNSDLALACGISPQRLEVCSTRLDELRERVDFAQLLDRLPDQPLRQYVSQSEMLAMNDYSGAALSGYTNTADFDVPQLNSLRPGQTADMTNADQGPPEYARSETGSVPRQQSQAAPIWQESEPPPQQEAQLDRGGRDWQQRFMAFDIFANNSLSQQQAIMTGGTEMPSAALIEESIARWIWLGSDLILARRVEVDGNMLIQGCWLDWPKLRAQLLEDVSDLMRGIDLVPVVAESEVRPAYTLATMPVQLRIVDEQLAVGIADLEGEGRTGPRRSPIRGSLIVAWSCLLFAAVAVAILLQGVIKLSERRGAFVSAVTHELRTPLTTFRMYAEMLAGDMVTGERRRKEYLSTLGVEADRLTHLVDNVLAYSRLERGDPGARDQQITVNELLERVTTRLADRAAQADKEFVVEVDHEARKVQLVTDPQVIEQILFNLVENACKYARPAADRRIHLEIDIADDDWCLRIRDHGPGVEATDRRRLFRPFSKSVERAAETAPGVGLGLALCRRLAVALKGAISLKESPEENGACFELRLPRR